MTYRSMAILAVTAVPLSLLGQDKVNQSSLVLDDFGKRVTSYVDLHKTARSKVHALKPTSSPEAIEHYEHELGHKIREMRRKAPLGAIFTPPIAEEFRKLIRLSMQGSAASRVQQSLNHAEPGSLPVLRVNSDYPQGFPLQSTPASMLQNLPHLPPEVEYRVVGHDLVLRDVDANLIVDILRNAVP